jgi:predicted nuclease of predicted toxin-antitoxin system
VISSISETHAGISDQEVIKIAKEQDLIILTFDKDYGEIIFRYKPDNPPSVIFFRVKGDSPDFAAKILIDLIENKQIDFTNTFSVIESEAIRQRKY